MKAKDCLTCKQHSLHGKYGEILVCAKGHKPRFYMPRNNFDFGWKRRCLDFEMSDDVEVLFSSEQMLKGVKC